MIQQTVIKIEDYICHKPLLTYKIDDYFLAKLYSLLLKHCLPHECVEHLMVAFGLLHQYVLSHNKLNNSNSHEELSASILDGDYFYSLYYEYCATHAFYLIEYDFASVLQKAEMDQLNNQELPLLHYIKLFLEEGGLHRGLFS
ncbi:MAG TPA: hypothetical protein DCY20_04840 [Firmicutes bacterium]|nr:hypothetical protein [Bacillota bacterium]